MKKYILYFIYISFSLSILFWFGGCAKTQEQKELKRTENNISIRIEGAVFPMDKQDVISAVAGYVKKIYVKNGDRVKKGDILYSLDKEIIKLNMDNVKIQIATLEQIRDHIQNRRVVVNGNTPAVNAAAIQLRKIAYLRSKGYISKFEEDKYKKSYINALYTNNNANNTDNYEKLKNINKQIVSNKIELKKLEYQLKHTDAYADIDGFVAGLDISVRQSIGANRKVCSIVNLDKVLVKAGFSTGLLPFLHVGQRIKVSFVTTPPYNTISTITKINPIVNPKFERMTIETIVPNHNYILQEGTRALINIPLSKEGQKQVKKYFLNNKRDTTLEIKSKI